MNIEARDTGQNIADFLSERNYRKNVQHHRRDLDVKLHPLCFELPQNVELTDHAHTHTIKKMDIKAQETENAKLNEKLVGSEDNVASAKSQILPVCQIDTLCFINERQHGRHEARCNAYVAELKTRSPQNE